MINKDIINKTETEVNSFLLKFLQNIKFLLIYKCPNKYRTRIFKELTI